MCGRKPCRKCAAKKRPRIAGTKKKRTMARRKKSNITEQLVNVAIGAGGYIVADQVSKLPFVSSNPQLSGIVKLAGGLYLGQMSKNPMLASVGQGMALNGALTLGRQYGVVSGIGRLPFAGNSTAIPGVAGKSGVSYGGNIVVK